MSTTLLESGANVPELYTVVDTAIRTIVIYNNIKKRSKVSAIEVSEGNIV